MKSRRPTQEDVAKLAGVSQSAVSQVLNRNDFAIPEETRQRILAVIDQLGYQPNSLARSLRSGETKTIGLIVPDASNLFFADIARRIENLGYENGYSVILCNSDNNLAKQSNYINTLIAKQIDGVIFISAGESKKDLEKLSNANIPIVVADRNVPLSLADVVLLNNEEAGYIAVKHLLDLGHKKIGCITGPSDVSPSMMRVSGYKRALQEFGIPIRSEYIKSGDFTFGEGKDAMHVLMTMVDRPSAVFILNDMMAIGAISTARRLGYKVPDDVSIIGFDDIELANAINPGLTTMAQPMQEIAEITTTRLIKKMISGVSDWKNEQLILKAKLVIRESTAPIKG